MRTFGRFLLWPLTLPPLLLVLLYASGTYLLMLILDRHLGLDMLSLLFLPWCYLLLGMLLLCGQQKLADVARGRFEDRVAAGAADLNPFQSGLALRLVALFALLPGSLLLAPDQMLVHVGLALIFPAVYLALVLEQSLRQSSSLSVIGQLLRGTLPVYPLLIVLISGSAYWLADGLVAGRGFLELALPAYGVLLAHPLAGWLLFLRRGALDLHTDDSPEQQSAAAALAEAQRLEDELDACNRLCGAGEVVRANFRLEAFLGSHLQALDPVVHERLRDLRYTHLFLEHGVNYLKRLMDRAAVRKAWAVFRDCQALDERFRPLSAQDLLAMTRVAPREDALLVESLLADFPRAYPDSDLLGEALFRQARVNIELLRDGSRGISLLKQLEAEHPEFAASDDYRRYRSRLRISRSAQGEPG